MRRTTSLLVSLAIIAASAPAWAQESRGPTIYVPDTATIKAIDAKRAELKIAIDRLLDSEANPAKGGHVPEPLLAAWVESMCQAAEWTIRHNEFDQKDSGKQILAVLDEEGFAGRSVPKSHRRAARRRQQISHRRFRFVCRRLHATIHRHLPFEIWAKSRKKYRLDVVLHGRDNTRTEVKMLAAASQATRPVGIRITFNSVCTAAATTLSLGRQSGRL